jgi:CBS domain-containing protein
MWDHDVGLVVVVDADRRPLSVVTDRDLAMAAYTQGLALSHIGVEVCMSTRMVTCSVDADVAFAAQLMREHKVRRIPVVNGTGQLDGILGLRELLRSSSVPSSRATSSDVVSVLTAVLT